MNMPLYDIGVASGLLSGILFGYVLEAAGFGSARKLTGQFSLKDWAVFKVMFTAVLVAAVGLYLLRLGGMIADNSVFVPTLFFWAIAAGGVLIGTGFAMGGYCPGTSAVGIAAGRIDALVFAVGMIVGTSVFAWVFEPLQGFYFAAKGPDAQRLPDLFGIPEWVVLGLLIVIAIAGFLLGSKLERARGGPFTAEDVNA
ncbi:putative transporter component [Hartmannibacter diazotrophicus]|uniref:Putative transporter component n=2 Tax=Hartmannibacter diazotrophicus TaxID=1482074 RepID=A0A2C9D7N6_9HYPH|nr:putative transporter component [Hartmannibacter diazotrophicus]